MALTTVVSSKEAVAWFSETAGFTIAESFLLFDCTVYLLVALPPGAKDPTMANRIPSGRPASPRGASNTHSIRTNGNGTIAPLISPNVTTATPAAVSAV